MTGRKLQMKTTKFDFKGKQVTVGTLRNFDNRVPLFEAPFLARAVNAEYGINLRLLDPKVADYLLNKTDKWREMGGAFPSLIGAVIGYEKQGKKLGEEIVFSNEDQPRVILSTGRYKGGRGIALVVSNITADDLKKDGNEIRVHVPEDRLVVVPDFPSKEGWYMPHSETTVPHGKKVGRSDEARHLWISEDSSYVGLLVRNDNYYSHSGRQNVVAFCGASDMLGMAVEVPEADLEKISSPV